MLARRAQAVMSSAQASGGAVSGWGCGFANAAKRALPLLSVQGSRILPVQG